MRVFGRVFGRSIASGCLRVWRCVCCLQFFLLIPMVLAAPVDDGQRIDLKKAIELALEKSPAFDSLKRELSISVLEEKTARARLWPSLDLTATHGVRDTSPRASTGPWASSLALELRETFYDNGVALTNRRIAELTRRQSEINFQDRRDQAILQVASQFLVVSLDSELVEIQEKQFQMVSRQYESIAKGYHQGLKTKKDYLRLKSQVSRGEIALLSARNSLSKAKFELARLIGLELPEGKSDVETLFVPFALGKVANDLSFGSQQVTEIFRSHAQNRSAELQKEIAQLNADLVARKTLPEWSITSALGYGSSNYLGTGQSFSDNAVWNWNALLEVKYNFFDWGIRSRDREIALQKKQIQENTIKATGQTLNNSLEQLASDVKRIQKSYTLAKELLAMERTNLEYIEREYQSGKMHYLDLVYAINDYSDAQAKFFKAASDLMTAKWTVLYHQGKLYDEFSK